MTRVCVFGAGAVGGYLAARMSTVPLVDLSIVARGPQLDAIRRNGLTLHDSDHDTLTVRPLAATDDPLELPPQDFVIVTLKSTTLASAAEGIASLLAPDGRAVFVTNGIPWWWNHGLAEDARLPDPHPVDPDGALWRAVTPERAIGCVALSSNRVDAPGVVVHSASNSWKLGTPAGALTAQLDDLLMLWRAAGLNVEASAMLRTDIWRKLLVNVPNHSLGSLTRLTTDGIYSHPDRIALARSLLEEVVRIATAYGYDLGDKAIDDTIRHFTPNGKGARPSMLQDVEAGRPLEVAAVFGAVQSLARRKVVATPALDMVSTLLTGLNSSIVGALRS